MDRPLDPLPTNIQGRIHQHAAAEHPQFERAQRLKQLAWLLDESIPIPLLGIRVGVDGLLGLIPGVGDLITTGISTYIIREAAHLGVPRVVLLRMAFNSAIDFVIGAVPLIGDFFDIGWKSNKRNVKLVLDHLDAPHKTARGSWLTVIGLTLGVGAAIASMLIGIGSLFAWLWRG